MITEDYCSYEVAKLLKEKGFDETCYACYEYFSSSVTMYQGWPFEYKGEVVHNSDNTVIAPTHQMAMKWLREVHGIFIAINNDDLDFNRQCYDLMNRDSALDPKILSASYAGYKTYEEAVEAALKYVLENLI